MNMDNSTQQFAYRWFITTVCGLIAGMALYMFAIGIIQGDGEAVKIIDSLYPIMRDTLAALLLMITGHQVGQVVTGIVQSKQTPPAVQPAKAETDGQSVGSVA